MSKKISILIQLISGYSLIIITIVAVTIFWSYRTSSQAVLQRSNQYILESVKQLQGKMDAILQDHDKLSAMIMFSPLIQEALKDLAEHRIPKTDNKEISHYIDQQTRSISYDIQFKLFGLSDAEAYTNSSSLEVIWDSEKEIRDAYWYPSIQENGGRMVWFGADVWLNGNIPVVMGARQINDWNRLNRLGTLFLVLPVEVIDNAVSQFHLGKNEKIQIADSFNTIVYSTNPKEIGMYMDSSIMDKFGSHKAHVIPLKVNSADMFVSYAYSSYSQWSVFAYIDAKEAVKDLNGIRRNVLLLGLLGMAVALLFTFFFSWTLSKPIRNLATKLSNVERGTTLPFVKTTMNKEMDILYSSYNSMLQNLDHTIADLSSKQISEKQAQIVALKAQFRPHFLYNTLNTIYWSLANKQLREESQMVLALSDLLRYSIDGGSEFVTVEDDLKQMERFIYLQKLRYEDKLQVEITVTPEVMNCQIMKLTLQPLVENAITHGLEPVIREVWLIRIRIRKEGMSLILTVEDNGKGMSEEKMKKALAGIEVTPEKLLHTGMGLSNLNFRIGLIYGQDYGLSLSNSELGGLRAEVTVPLQYDQG
ncbi:MAG: sensor histidine kinase [Gorillibacterium sp.]|nr:sensor histidine kinase [Gorillibacterium sp.]